MTFDTAPVHGSSRSVAAFVSGKLARRIVVTAVALGSVAASAFGAEIQNKVPRYNVPWSQPSSWIGGVVPGASDDVGFTEVCDFLYDANASGTVGSMSGKALTLTLARSLEVRDLYLLEGKIFDGGYNLKVTGTLTNVAKGYPQPGGGKRTGQGGNLDVANLSLGRASDYIFYPGDIIRSTYTAVLYQGWPDITVTQDPVNYANRLDKGLSFENEAPGAISLGPTSATDQAEITLNWDAGLSNPIDWTLRWKGNHETELRNYHANSQLKVGSLPTGKAFNPKDNIFFDSATGYTFVGFKPPAQQPGCFTEEFSGTGVGPNLEDPEGVYAAAGGVLRKTTDAGGGRGAGHRYVRTKLTNYRSTDWTYTIQFDSLNAPWENMIIGLGAAERSKVNWVVDSPDASVYLSIDNQQPFGQPGRIQLVVQRDGNSRPLETVGSYSGAGGKFSVKIDKRGNNATFSLTVINAAGTYPVTPFTVDLAARAPWLTDANTRLFFGGRRTTLSWDNMVVTCP